MAITAQYATPYANVMPRTPISARTTTVTGMQHPGVAAPRRPGPGDTAGAQQAGGRASPSEYWDHRQPNMAGRGPAPVIRTYFVPRGGVFGDPTALGPNIAGNPAAEDDFGRENGRGRDAAPGSGRAPSARPRGHYLSAAGQWAGAPQRDQPPFSKLSWSDIALFW